MLYCNLNFKPMLQISTLLHTHRHTHTHIFTTKTTYKSLCHPPPPAIHCVYALINVAPTVISYRAKSSRLLFGHILLCASLFMCMQVCVCAFIFTLINRTAAVIYPRHTQNTYHQWKNCPAFVSVCVWGCVHGSVFVLCLYLDWTL